MVFEVLLFTNQWNKFHIYELKIFLSSLFALKIQRRHTFPFLYQSWKIREISEEKLQKVLKMQNIKGKFLKLDHQQYQGENHGENGQNNTCEESNTGHNCRFTFWKIFPEKISSLICKQGTDRFVNMNSLFLERGHLNTQSWAPFAPGGSSHTRYLSQTPQTASV